MHSLIEKREGVQKFYTKYSGYIDKVIRFLVSLSVLGFINANTEGTAFSEIYIIGLIAVVCAFLPLKLVTVVVNVYTLFKLYLLAPGLAVTAACFMLLMFIFYFRFTPKQGYVFLLMPIAFVLKIPMLIPIVCGLLYTPVSGAAVVLGTMFYYMLDCVKSYTSVLDNVAQTGVAGQITTFAQLFFGNMEMWLVCLTLVVCLVLVYNIRKSSIDNAWKISIIGGALVAMIALLFISLDVDFQQSKVLNQFAVIIGTVISVGLAFVVELFQFSVDYSRTENLSFEDDEYYYYVKAVPKITMAAPEKVVKTIHERQETKAIHIPEDELELEKKLFDELDLERLLEEELNKEQ